MTRYRRPQAGEPGSSTPILVRFGMTKGALVAVAILTLGAIVGFWRLEQLAHRQAHLTSELAVIANENHRTIDRLEAQERHNRAALREVCRESETVGGLAGATSELFRRIIESGVVDVRLLPAYAATLTTFDGYMRIIRERAACQAVQNP